MTTANSALLGFAAWTLATLMLTVGVHRWHSILSGRARIDEFPADARGGPDWYQRATRAHLNCVENLPVFAAVVVCASAAGVTGPVFDVLPVLVLGARVCQTVTHVAFAQTARVVTVRFGFFSVQIAALLIMMAALVSRT
jgi:uncharacterized MAPEG superfamily protein